jgi:uncharacterized protein YkwD
MSTLFAVFALMPIALPAVAAESEALIEEAAMLPLPIDAGVPTALVATELEYAVLELVNADRIKNGLQPVAFDTDTLLVARARAASQFAAPSLTHYDASGQIAFAKLLQENGLAYEMAGENLARSPSDDAATLQLVEEALMRSPTHRRNILERSYTHLSVGAATDANGRIVFAQIFRAN